MKRLKTDWTPIPSLPGYEQRLNEEGILETRGPETDKRRAWLVAKIIEMPLTEFDTLFYPLSKIVAPDDVPPAR